MSMRFSPAAPGGRNAPRWWPPAGPPMLSPRFHRAYGLASRLRKSGQRSIGGAAISRRACRVPAWSGVGIWIRRGLWWRKKRCIRSMFEGQRAVISRRRSGVDRKSSRRGWPAQNRTAGVRVAARCFFSDQPLEEGRRVRVREPHPFRIHLPASRPFQRPAPDGPSMISLGVAIQRVAAALGPRLPVANSCLKQLKKYAGRNLKLAFTTGPVTDVASLPFCVA